MSITSDAQNRLPNQFKESKNINNYILSILEPTDDIPLIVDKLTFDVSIDDAIGVQLDLIGIIVGLERGYINSSEVDYFCFDTGIGAGFDEGEFLKLGDSSTGINQMTDQEYRVFLKTKISINKNKNTPEELISIYKYLFNSDSIFLEEGSSFILLSIGKELTNTEKWYIKNFTLPKPAGVALIFGVEYKKDSFAFNGQNGKGFNLGRFAKLI